MLTYILNVCVSATSPNTGSELEQARPQTSGEEELQLQLALAMSREAAEQVHATHMQFTSILFFVYFLLTGFTDYMPTQHISST